MCKVLRWYRSFFRHRSRGRESGPWSHADSPRALPGLLSRVPLTKYIWHPPISKLETNLREDFNDLVLSFVINLHAHFAYLCLSQWHEQWSLAFPLNFFLIMANVDYYYDWWLWGDERARANNVVCTMIPWRSENVYFNFSRGNNFSVSAHHTDNFLLFSNRIIKLGSLNDLIFNEQ